MSFNHPLVWFAITVTLLLLCTFLPIKVKNDQLRRNLYWIILVPVSLILIFYAYPVGIEVFRRLAITP